MSFILDDMKKSNTNVRNNKTTPEIAPVETETNTPTSASSVQIFNNPEFGDVRVVMQDGEPWFVGKDVAEALGYERATKAIQDHVDFEDKDGVPIQDSIGRMQKTPIISESGLYSLILSSKLPSAKKFKRWVTSEVLPAIRKTGGYVDQSRSDLFIDTYLPFADETTRTLFYLFFTYNYLLSIYYLNIFHNHGIINGILQNERILG